MLAALLLALFVEGLAAAAQPVVLNAVYTSTLQTPLLPTFGVYYGVDSLQMTRVELDFAIPQIVMQEDTDFTSDGIDCSSAFGCEVTNQVEYISDSRGSRIFPSSLAYLPLRLPNGHHMEVQRDARLRFNLFRGGKFRVRNVIGLAPNSAFWEYIARRFGQPSYKVSFHTDFGMRNVDQIMDSMDLIFTKIIFFDDTEFATSGYKEMTGDALAFGNIFLNFPGFLNVAKDPVFRMEIPYFFRICQSDYDTLLRHVREEICPDPAACDSPNDMFGNLSGKPKLSFVFPQSADFHTKTPYRVDVPLSELVYVNERNKIAYNFAPISADEVGYKAERLELGLLFLKRVELEVQYTSSGRLILAISDKRFPFLATVYMTYLAGAASVSFLIAAVLACCLSSGKVDSASSYSSSFL